MDECACVSLVLMHLKTLNIKLEIVDQWHEMSTYGSYLSYQIEVNLNHFFWLTPTWLVERWYIMVEYNMILNTIWKQGSWIFVQTMNSEKTTQTLPLWKHYGVSFLIFSGEKITWHIEFTGQRHHYEEWSILCQWSISMINKSTILSLAQDVSDIDEILNSLELLWHTIYNKLSSSSTHTFYGAYKCSLTKN